MTLYRDIQRKFLDAIDSCIGETNDSIFQKIDQNLNGNKQVDLIGGPCKRIL
jgi:hypothetical protein